MHDRFERFCRARCYGEMEYEDLINETLLVAYEKLETLKSEESFLSFLFSISIRLLANNHRKKKPEVGHKVEEFAGFSNEGNPEQAAEVHLLHQALSQLSADQREAIILFEISGFSIKEVAQIQEVSVHAVKQRLRRGRNRLTELLTFESALKTGKEKV